ncbi:MAG: hypothetical protein LC119_15160 [Burkholderiales bacterium]|nr:hypothetical protein [Burkholderiales bacterium]
MTLLLAFDVLVTIAWIISLHGHRAALLSLARECDDLERRIARLEGGGR